MLLALENPPFVVPAELHVWNLWGFRRFLYSFTERIVEATWHVFLVKLIAANRLACITFLHSSLWCMVSLLDHQLGLIGSLQVKVSISQYGWSMIITIICSFCCRTMWKLRKHQTSPNIIKRHQTSTNIINHQLVPMNDWLFFAFNIHAAGS